MEGIQDMFSRMVMRRPLNQKMVRKRLVRKYIFHNNMHSMELHFKLQCPTRRFWRDLELWIQRAVTGRFLKVYLGLTLKHCNILSKKREVRPKISLTCETDLQFSHVSSILVGGLAGVVSILVQTDGCSVCCIQQYSRVLYQCCVSWRRSSGWTWQHTSFYC